MSHPRPCWQSFFWRDVRRTAARRRTRYAPRRRPRRRISSCFAPVPQPLRSGSQATAFCRSVRRNSAHRPIRSNSMRRGRGRRASSTPREMSSRSTESSQASDQLIDPVGSRDRMVPRRGLEPPLLAEHGPEPCASTNSAIWAGGRSCKRAGQTCQRAFSPHSKPPRRKDAGRRCRTRRDPARAPDLCVRRECPSTSPWSRR